MRTMNNGSNRGSVISMRAVDQKQDYQLEWPYGMHVRFCLDYVCMVFAYFNRENLPEQAQLVCGKLVIY